VKIIGDVEKSGNVKTDADKKFMVTAKDRSERTLSNIAVNWHNEGRKTRDDDTFEYANEVYGDYLVLFPDNKKSYDLRFYWGELLNDYLRKYPEAEQQYTAVVVQDGKAIDAKQKPGKWLPNSAFNAVYAGGRGRAPRRAEGRAEAPERRRPQDGGAARPAAEGSGRRLRALPQVPAQGREAGRGRLQGGEALLRPPPLRRGGVPLQRDRPHRAGPQVRQR
jgi:hypothetical protein